MDLRKLIVIPSMILLFTITRCSKDEEEILIASITDIHPKTGQPGTVVTIVGTNFSTTPSENIVKFNGITAEVTQATSNELLVNAPNEGLSGIVELSVRGLSVSGPEFKFYNLYLFGSNYYKAAFWKDGVNSTLEKGHIYDFEVSNNKTYAVGYVDNNLKISPAYWENGILTSIPGVTDSVTFSAIAVNGTDVYISGTSASKYPKLRRAILWKNGTLIFSTDGSNECKAFDCASIGNDYYLIGNDYPNSTVWKNGVSTSYGLLNLTKAKVINSDLYIVGRFDGIGLKYWLNGSLSETEVTYTGNDWVTDISIYNNKMYLGGYDYNATKYIAKYWSGKDGFTLSDGSTSRYVSSIEATDDALYIVTNQESSYHPYLSIVLKNETDITPDYGPGITGAIQGIRIVYY